MTWEIITEIYRKLGKYCKKFNLCPQDECIELVPNIVPNEHIITVELRQWCAGFHIKLCDEFGTETIMKLFYFNGFKAIDELKDYFEELQSSN